LVTAGKWFQDSADGHKYVILGLSITRDKVKLVPKKVPKKVNEKDNEPATG
jgi:hypothetical protein